MKNKLTIPTILFIVVLIFSFFVLSQEKNQNQNQTNEPIVQENQEAENQAPITNGPNDERKQAVEQTPIILFYGDGCPHCTIVEKYIEENNVQNKISFVRKEVYYNQNNAKELEDKAKICGLPTDSIGVPFLWDGKKCLIGDQDIINFFKQITNEQ